MWLHLKIIFHDGSHRFVNNFAFWIPSVAALPPNRHVELEFIFNEVTNVTTFNSRMSNRTDDELSEDDEPEMV
jgi:hypothetical protein